jgi:hypothetical protein
LGDRDPTCSPFPPSSGLSLAGFFFSLHQPVFEMFGDPAIRQQGFQGGSIGGGNGRNPTQHVR